MEYLIKFLPPEILQMLLPLIAIKVGTWLKDKDTNTTGADDAAGNLLIAAAPALASIETGQENAFKKALIALRDTINNYLQQNP